MRSKTMKVECGSLRWKGEASCFDEAVIKSLSRALPEEPAALLRVHNGLIWYYIDFESAAKIAGYTIAVKRKERTKP